MKNNKLLNICKKQKCTIIDKNDNIIGAIENNNVLNEILCVLNEIKFLKNGDAFNEFKKKIGL